MPHTTKSPNPQNGSSNPYGYNPNTYSIGNGYGTTASSGYGNITVNGNGAIGSVTLSPARQVMTMKWVGDELKTVLTGEENGTYVNLELTPERDITSYEQLRITTLIASISAGSLPSCAILMSYVRRYHLERHFKFSAA